MMVTNGIGNDSIIISRKKKDYILWNNNDFQTVTIRIKDLPNIVTQYNYSLINWIGGKRDGDNFKSATGFMVDIDEGLTIDEAQHRLDDQNLNYVIIPSRNHTAELHKYHILIFFSHPIYALNAYKEIVVKIKEDVFPELDTNTLDGARFAYGSPSNFTSINCFTGENYNTLEFDHLWTSLTEINTAKEGFITAYETNGHMPCQCPFHEDSNPSAFINYSDESENYFIRCSACDHTYWMQEDQIEMEELFQEYWSFRDKYYQAGFTEDEFYFNPLGDKKFLLRINAHGSTADKNKALAYLAQRKHIAHISRVDYVGNISAEENFYQISKDRGVIEVHYAPIESQIEDNEFIEDYLKSRFEEQLVFIKEYLAVFTHTNHEKLPTLVLKGPRGNSKSTFAEFVGAIYQPLTTDWSGSEGMFSYEMEKKFLIVEENAHSDEKQYKSLKKYMGQSCVPINKKFKDPFKAKNNMNIIILSNKDVPMYVEKSECPTNTKNNQFFVWGFPPIEGDLDNEINYKLEARLGYYVRTELKTVFDGLTDRSKYRYSIEVPITEYEKELFEDNISETEMESNELVNMVCNCKAYDDGAEILYPLVKEGYLPSTFVKDRFQRNHLDIVKELKKQKLLEGKSKKKWNGVKTVYSYKMTKKFIDLFNESQTTLEELKN